MPFSVVADLEVISLPWTFNCCTSAIFRVCPINQQKVNIMKNHLLFIFDIKLYLVIYFYMHVTQNIGTMCQMYWIKHSKQLIDWYRILSCEFFLVLNILMYNYCKQRRCKCWSQIHSIVFGSSNPAETGSTNSNFLKMDSEVQYLY